MPDNFYFQQVLLADARESKTNEVDEFLQLSYGINCKWFVQNSDVIVSQKFISKCVAKCHGNYSPKMSNILIFQFNLKLNELLPIILNEI